MPSNRYRGPPMTLANMRAQGVRSLWVVLRAVRTGRPNLIAAVPVRIQKLSGA
jgi:hypothetical protein